MNNMKRILFENILFCCIIKQILKQYFHFSVVILLGYVFVHFIDFVSKITELLIIIPFYWR